jgi:hypothetical protein
LLCAHKGASAPLPYLGEGKGESASKITARASYGKEGDHFPDIFLPAGTPRH